MLGTASAVPISDRNPSAQVLKVHGRLFLIDCGEGTQQQFRRCHMSFLKVEAIFLSHIHGDHLFGLFGVLSTMAMYGRTQKLPIYAPKSFGPVLKFYMSYFGDGMSYEPVHIPLDVHSPELVHESRELKVSAFPLHHKIDCFGFRFDYKEKYSYAYCSDTMPFPELQEWVKDVNLLYHEATYTCEFADKAAQRFHSTTKDAATCAKAAGAGKLLIGHYSSRIRDISIFEKECRDIFPDTTATNDGDVFDIC